MTDYLLKIPDSALLKLEIVENGKLKSYIEELEHDAGVYKEDIKELKDKIDQITKASPAEKKEINKEEHVIKLNKQIVILESRKHKVENKKLKLKNKELINQVIQLKLNE